MFRDCESGSADELGIPGRVLRAISHLTVVGGLTFGLTHRTKPAAEVAAILGEQGILRLARAFLRPRDARCTRPRPGGHAAGWFPLLQHRIRNRPAAERDWGRRELTLRDAKQPAGNRMTNYTINRT